MNKLIQYIIAFSLKNKLFVLFATGVLIVWGAITFHNMPIEAFPDVTNTEIDVITQWPGRSAEEVEKYITIPVEIALNPVQKKISLRSTSIFGLSYVKIIFEDEVKDPEARLQVMSLINNATLPPGVTPAIQPPTGPTGEIFRYTLRSSFRNVRELKSIQDWVIDRKLRAVPGVGDLNSFGGKTKTYEIKVDPGKLTSLGLTPLDVYTAVQNTNINIGGDMIFENDEAYAVRGIGLINDVNEINNIIIKNNNGVPLLVKDVAQVDISNLPRLGWITRSDAGVDSLGHRTISKEDDVVECIVVMRKGENPSQVITGVEKEVEKLNRDILPADTKIVPYYDRRDLISFATHTVMHNLVEGILLVILLVSLFLFDWRTTLIVSLVIPISLLFAFICLRTMGMTANLLSMGAVDFGIIIDGAVVMVEGIFVALSLKSKDVGMPKFNKLSKMGLYKLVGTKMGKAIFFSKIIIITCLVPIFSFQKVEGKMFSPLAYTLGFTLLGALITTLTLVPVLISLLLNKNVKERHNPFVEWVHRFMMKGFIGAYKRKKLVLIIASVVVVIGLYSFRFLGSEFLPELNEGAIWLRVQLPYSASLQKGVEVSKQVRDILMTFPQVKSIVSQTGRPDDGTDVSGFYNNEFDVVMYPESEWKPKVSEDDSYRADDP